MFYLNVVGRCHSHAWARLLLTASLGTWDHIPGRSRGHWVQTSCFRRGFQGNWGTGQTVVSSHQLQTLNTCWVAEEETHADEDGGTTAGSYRWRILHCIWPGCAALLSPVYLSVGLPACLPWRRCYGDSERRVAQDFPILSPTQRPTHIPRNGSACPLLWGINMWVNHRGHKACINRQTNKQYIFRFCCFGYYWSCMPFYSPF